MTISVKRPWEFRDISKQPNYKAGETLAFKLFPLNSFLKSSLVYSSTLILLNSCNHLVAIKVSLKSVKEWDPWDIYSPPKIIDSMVAN